MNIDTDESLTGNTMIATSTTSLLRDRELQQTGDSGGSYEIKEWTEEAVQKPNNTFITN